MRVVWICHFSNQEIQEFLQPVRPINESAPWITTLAGLLENQKDLEIHIISPHEYIRSDHNFEIRGIHYHFFNAHIPFWGRHWPGKFKFDYWTDFFSNKLKVRKIIDKIKPDLIHLHGPENAYYSSSIIQFRDRYPVLITIQGFVSLGIRPEDYQLRKCIKYEKRIIRLFYHFGYRTQRMGRDIQFINPDAKLHWHNYPLADIALVEVEKKYDIVFFARVLKEKGIEDLFHAISIVKKDLRNVSACIIGFVDPAYFTFLSEMAARLGIVENIIWAGFLKSQQDVHAMASRAKISVLPTWNEIISGTIIESMFLKLPVVAYSVGSIPEINDKEEYVTLVNKGNVVALGEKILWLLTNPGILTVMGEKAYIRVTELLDNNKIPYDLLKAYKEVIDDFKSE